MTGERKGFCFTMQQEEIWKDIPEYEGLYQASNLGRIKRLKTAVRGAYGNERTLQERICKPHRHPNGYTSVCLCKNGVAKTVSIHRVIATLFLPNPNNLPQVNHKDENKQNNNASNLEWCDAQYNLTFGTRVQRVTKKLCRTVRCYSMDGSVVGVFDGIAIAKRELNLPSGAIPLIVNCCKGKRKTAYGYKWEYV